MYTECLAEAAYYVESDGVAVIIDPMREWEPYVEKARERGATIKFIFETHFHADFVSGHLDLARETNARIVFGPTAETSYDIHSAKDGEEFNVGNIRLRVLHTPGHTLESSCFLLIDEKGENHALFTGDTLFINDVGRPDLSVSTDLTREELAKMLYHSVHSKIMPLQDSVIVYPAHGAGSACGKNLGTERWDTLGHQKQVNYALRAPDEESFIKQVTENIAPSPQYFPKNAALNKTGYERFAEIVNRGNQALSATTFRERISEGVRVIDTRLSAEVVGGYIPGSICIGLDGLFASWVGTLVENLEQPLLVVAEVGREVEAVERLARVGYNNCVGFLEGGYKSWSAENLPVTTINSVSAGDFAQGVTEKTRVVDVRKAGEYEEGHLQNARNLPLDYITDHVDELSREEPVYLHCLTGYRSVIAISVLKRAGYDNLVNINGGMEELEKTALTLSPTT